ncbi:type II secretion system protein [Methylobacter sp. YRD-M1]|uniref:type II secretion system protein n=1 Tax=Methylobacter sp. YRD-M1 TaxID=2911520 RepID=UPI00227D6EB9|nr:prepilin-type N-terminal cleavage/methylation domain-containing protein [Methylobacter sp. YRD-M1]WAK03173.1 prepilin-type N-terminal cleavage/methylation domain-containing protein [Methylobacter sp. YRD-M1]
MNINQMKEAIKKFRAADFSGLKDEELRAKAQKLQAKQGGFTLLELLVVIALMATLATAAMVAYEGIGESSQATAAANNTSTADSAIRNFRAVTQNYPDQWDHLVTNTGAALGFAAANTNARFANLPLAVSATAGDFRDMLNQAMTGVGITELQVRANAASTAGVEPNLQHNEGAAGADAVETAFNAITNFAVLPTWGDAGACSVNGAAMAGTKLDGTTAVDATDGARQNVINDSLEDDECNLVIAVGFGHDAAHSTSDSSVAISTAPTFSSKNINPAANYARYIALFHVGKDTGDGAGGAADDNITADELFSKPRLLAVLDTEGNMIDENIAAQNPN